MTVRHVTARSAQELKGLQRLMAGVIMRPLTRSVGMRMRWRDGRSMRRVASSFVKPNDRLSSFERLEIYNRQYWFRVLDSFYEDFPGLRAVMGDRRFDAMAEAYLARHPSSCFTMRNLGSRLGEFLQEEPRWIAERPVMARDMARFEWAQVVAFDGEARPVLKAADFRGKDPTELKLGLQPYLTLLEMDFPLDDFVIALKRNAALRSEASQAMQGKRKAAHARKIRLPRPDKTFLAVHRQNESLYYKRLAPEGYRILVELEKGRTLGAACSAALRGRTGDWAGRIRGWFENWTALGWFCRPE